MTQPSSPWIDTIQQQQRPLTPSVAIIGGGIAGLTAAYKLSKQGFRVTLYEAAQRLGGRIYTDYQPFSPQGQYCEKGGEWIDSTHHDIRNLAHELGLDIQDISKKRTGEELFYFGGEVYAPSHFLRYNTESKTAEGAYAPLARHIGKDRRRARDNPAYARQLDQMNIEDYLNRAHAALGIPYWVTESIKVAYKGEFGTAPCEQSALLLINQIGTGLKRPFEIYGPKQDESQRIRGGNHKLIEALQQACEKQGVKIFPGHQLTKIDYRDDLSKAPLYLELNHDGRKKTRHFEYVVSALPFTKLREVDGLDALAGRQLLNPLKLQTIRELGYGNIVKIMLGMNGHPWENNPRFSIPSNGSFRTGNPYLQNTWITSVGQKGEDSILTVLVAGNEAKQPVPVIVRECKKAAAELFDMSEETVFNHRHAFHVWPKDQFIRASYSAMKPGQYTTLRLAAGTPEVGGRMGFVGEHADPELYGYMSGAVRSATCEAERIIEHAKALSATAIPTAAISAHR